MAPPSVLTRAVLLCALACSGHDHELVLTSAAECPPPGAALALSVDGELGSPICIDGSTPVRTHDCSTNPLVDPLDATFVVVEVGDLRIVSAQVRLPRGSGEAESAAGTQVLKQADELELLLFLGNQGLLLMRVEAEQIRVEERLPGGSLVDDWLVGECTSGATM